MSGVQSISKGVQNVMRTDANLRDYKISGDTVKERGSLGKTFARLKEYFGNKSESGRMKIEQRNATIGNAMLKMVNERLDAKLGRIDANAESKGLTQEAVDRKKRGITAATQTLKDRITVLRDSKQMPPNVLKQIKSMDPSVLSFLGGINNAEAKEKFVNLLTRNVDKEAFKATLTNDINQCLQENNHNKFDLDAARGMVAWPGRVRVPGERMDVGPLHAYLDQISNNTPAVKDFIINVCNQGGVHFSLQKLYLDPVVGNNFPTVEDCRNNKVGLSASSALSQDWRVRLDPQDDGSIDITFRGHMELSDLSGKGRQFNMHENVVKLHLPVDDQKNFIMENNQPKFEIANFTINDVKQ